MALQSSGQISMSNINTELGRGSSTAQISLDTAENGGYGIINANSCSKPSSSNPAAMSEWYGYNHTAPASKTRYVYARLESNISSGSWSIVADTTTIASGLGTTQTTCIQRGTLVKTDNSIVTFYVKNQSGVNVRFFGTSGDIATCLVGGSPVLSYTVTFDPCTIYFGITVRVVSGAFVTV